MKTKVLGRAAALSMAAIAAISTMAVPASADVSTSLNALGQYAASGTANILNWSFREQATVHTAYFYNTYYGTEADCNAAASVTYQTNAGALTIVRAAKDMTKEPYDASANVNTLNGYYVAATTLSTDNYGVNCFDTTAHMNKFTTMMTNVCTYQSKAENNTADRAATGIDGSNGTPVFGGTDALAEWKADWTAYINYLRDWKAYTLSEIRYNNAMAAISNNYYGTAASYTTWTDHTGKTWGNSHYTAFYGASYNGITAPANPYAMADPDTTFNGTSGTTTYTNYAINGADAKAIAAAPATYANFTQYKYTTNNLTSTKEVSQLTGTAINGAVVVGTAIDIDPLTGIVKTGTKYSIVSGGTGTGTSGTTGTTTTTSNTWLPDSSYRTASRYAYKGNNGFWYTSQAAAEKFGNGYSGDYKDASSNSYAYFSAYYGTYSAANGNDGYTYATSDTTSGTAIYYNSATQRYYPTLSLATNAANGGSITTYSTTSSGNYFNLRTGQYYSTAALAAAATNANDVYVMSTGTMYAATANQDLLDPYYLYFNGLGTTTNNYDPTEPCIYGATRRSGWNTILSTVKQSAKGSTVTIDMNSATALNKTVVATAKAAGVNLRIYTSNGAQITIPATKITTAAATDLAVRYTCPSIPTSLVKKAKSYNTNAVSTARISVGDGSSFGFTAGVRVKFSAKRSGYTAKIYRYNSSRNSLVLAGTAEINSNGYASFNLSKGGEFIVVVKK